ncbi:MAG: PadR family transcriptional regulator [Rhizomicrobium sp.]|jgi:PadR family transcriptional regulator PadR
MPLKPPPDKTPENRRTQMYKGVLELAVLSLLKDGAQYGLKILDRMRDEVGLDLAEGTLYPLLHRLEKAGLVKPEWRMEQGISHPRKYYTLTKAGAADFAEQRTTWLELCDRLNAFLQRATP